MRHRHPLIRSQLLIQNLDRFCSEVVLKEVFFDFKSVLGQGSALPATTTVLCCLLGAVQIVYVLLLQGQLPEVYSCTSGTPLWSPERLL